MLGLYFWAYFANVKSISDSLLVSDVSAVLAGATLIVSFVLYLWVPKKFTTWASFTTYTLLAATAAALVVTTGGPASPFIALWMLLAVFAGIFGGWGIVPMFVAVNTYLVLEYISHGAIDRGSIVTIVLAGELPLLVSYIIWHRKSSHESGSDKAYRDLANELSQVANKSEVVINAIADGVVAVDNQGIIQLINPAAQQLLGWGKQDALSLSYKSILKMTDKKDADVEPATDPVQQVLSTNKPLRTDVLSLSTSSGKKFLASIVVSPVGQVGAGVIVVFRDITREKAEEREQAEFISTASHEMRTPVASIEGYLGLALNPATATIDAKARDFIQKAHESAEHLGRLFQDLLDVSKAEDGRLSNNPKVIDVVNFAHDIVQGLLPKAQEKGLRVLYKPIPDDSDNAAIGERHLTPVFYVYLDNDHIREIVANLVENAIKYTPAGDVVIDVDGDSEHVTISISDSGIGIPAEDMPHLFQKFYRVDNTATREIGGTGLGLYLCRRLAETLGGRIWAESEFKKGSTFYLELPRISHEEAMQKIDQATDQAEAVAEFKAKPPQAQITAPLPPQPAPVYTAPATPTPVQPVTPAVQQPAPQQQPNIPLSAIEQNPAQYTQPRPLASPRPQSVSIPVRDEPQIRQ